jgi:hypothetical protein
MAPRLVLGPAKPSATAASAVVAIALELDLDEVRDLDCALHAKLARAEKVMDHPGEGVTGAAGSNLAGCCI